MKKAAAPVSKILPSLGTRIKLSPTAQRFGHRCERAGKHVLRSLLDRVLPLPENLPIPIAAEVRRVLLVRPTFRIGNLLIASPLTLALRQRFPDAQIDCLVGDSVASLLNNLPIGAVHCMSRQFILRPWRFLGLVRRLREQHYDVSVETGASLSGGLCAMLAGARYRIGTAGAGDRFQNVRLPRARTSHVYDRQVAYAHVLGADCPDRPLYATSAAERDEAAALLRAVGLGGDDAPQPFVALFVGGHQTKRWPPAKWLAVARALGEAGARVVVFVGPEELPVAEELRQGLDGCGHLILPQPLRRFAALWSMAALIVTPDSGPMHLAAAFGVPTIAIVQMRRSLNYVPRAVDDVVLMQPSVDDVVAAVQTHRCWPSLVEKSAHPSSPCTPAPAADDGGPESRGVETSPAGATRSRGTV